MESGNTDINVETCQQQTQVWAEFAGIFSCNRSTGVCQVGWDDFGPLKDSKQSSVFCIIICCKSCKGNGVIGIFINYHLTCSMLLTPVIIGNFGILLVDLFLSYQEFDIQFVQQVDECCTVNPSLMQELEVLEGLSCYKKKRRNDTICNSYKLYLIYTL